MLRTFSSEEDHCTELVRFFVLPSLYFPVAESCWLIPAGITAPLGAIRMDSSVGATTAMASVALTPAKLVVIVAAPSAFPVASPLSLTATMPFGLAPQVTEADIS